MVKLHHHFDTSDTIFLLLQYAAGGCLWNQVKSFRKHFSQGTSDFLDKNSDMSDLPQPNSDAPQSTSIEPPELNCELDWSEKSIDRSSEMVVEKFDAKLVFNEGNSKTNNLNSSNEPCCVENEPVILTPSTGESTSHNLKAGQKTCLDEDKLEQSLNDKDNETGKTCATISDNLLGFLDHVSKDYSTMDKCVQYWIAELLLAMNSVHSCGIILK